MKLHFGYFTLGAIVLLLFAAYTAVSQPLPKAPLQAQECAIGYTPPIIYDEGSDRYLVVNYKVSCPRNVKFISSGACIERQRKNKTWAAKCAPLKTVRKNVADYELAYLCVNRKTKGRWRATIKGTVKGGGFPTQKFNFKTPAILVRCN